MASFASGNGLLGWWYRIKMPRLLCKCSLLFLGVFGVFFCFCFFWRGGSFLVFVFLLFFLYFVDWKNAKVQSCLMQMLTKQQWHSPSTSNWLRLEKKVKPKSKSRSKLLSLRENKRTCCYNLLQVTLLLFKEALFICRQKPDNDRTKTSKVIVIFFFINIHMHMNKYKYMYMNMYMYIYIYVCV